MACGLLAWELLAWELSREIAPDCLSARSRRSANGLPASRQECSAMSLIDTRGHQMFPVLDAAQIETAKRFASDAAQRFAPGELVYDVGERHTPMWLVLD